LEVVNENNSEDKQIDLIKLFWMAVRAWPFIVGSLVVALAISFLFIRYAPRIYSVEASVLVKNVSNFELSNILFENDQNSMNGDISNEMLILKSFPLIERTILELDYNVYLYRKTAALERTLEIHGAKSPFLIKATPIEEGNYPSTKLVEIIINQDETFNLLDDEENFFLNNEMNFGEEFELDGYWITISLNEKYDESYDLTDQFLFSVSSLQSVVNMYRGNLIVRIAEKDASVIQLLIDATIPEKEEEFLDKLLANYIKRNLDEKNEASSNSIEFIDEELKVITDSLRRIESKLQYFKSSNKISDLSSEGDKIIERLMDLDVLRSEIILKQKYYKYIDQYFESFDPIDILIHPSSFGLVDEYLNNLASRVIQLQTERKSMVGENSILRNRIDGELAQMRQTIKSYVGQLEETNSIKLRDMNERSQILENSIEGLSSSEIQLMNINRLHDLSESLFLLLMEKKAEAQILRSSNTPDYVVIDPPRVSSANPVSPKKHMWYGLAILLGISLPLLVIVAFNFFDDKVRTKEDFEHYRDITFLGAISSGVNKEEGFAVRNSPKSRLSESFRSLRANMNYLRSEQKQVLLITSFFPSEGKTFVVSNLAQSLSFGKNRVLIIGGDLRKPRVHEIFEMKNDIGLSSYLATGADITEVIKPTGLENIDIIASGPVPPNPLELLEEDKFGQLLNKLRDMYDYILIDTAPFGLVSDTIALIEKADITLIITRSGKTRKSHLKNIHELVTKNKNSSFGLVLNDVKGMDGYGYNNGYGNHGYYEA